MINVTQSNNELSIETPFSRTFVTQLKAAIPSEDRKWDGAKKVWVVSNKYEDYVRKLILSVYGENVFVQRTIFQAQAAPSVRVLEVRYLGVTKERGGDERTAFGWTEGGWNAIFTEKVLRDYFLGTDVGDHAGSPLRRGAITLYGVLGIHRAVGVEEIRAAYRRMAKQWHPDVCKEPDAGEMFIKIKRAYEILSDEGKRGMYDAGLMLEGTVEDRNGRVTDAAPTNYGYRAPLRCGLMMVEAEYKLGRYAVKKIYQWEDIVNERGQVLVVSWPAGGGEHAGSPIQQMWEERWV